MKTIIWLLLLVMLIAQGCAKEKSTFKAIPQYTDLSEKTEVACPAQTNNTAVLFTFGQSNSANHAEKRFDNTDPRIINFYLGKCYIAKDPFLGATGDEGSVWIPLAQEMLETGNYDNIIFINSGVSGQTVAELAPGGHYFERVTDQIKSTYGYYEVTDYLYHQGEADWQTAYSDYKANLEHVIQNSFDYYPNAKFFVSVTTKCLTEQEIGPQVEQAQRDVVNNVNIFQGPDTDANVPISMRRADRCHFSEAAQLLVGDLWFHSIEGI